MKLELATKSYRKIATVQLMTAANDAIDSLMGEWEKTMTAVLAGLVEDFGNEIVEDLGGEPSKELKWTFDPMSAAVKAWIIKNGAEDIKSILATNKADVKRILMVGMDENLSTAQIARNVRQFYTDNSAFKAMRVARTEVTKASSFGNLEAARQSQVVETKTWLSSRDDRVRDEHEALDGETVKLEGVFSNGLEYPSEPMCRCVLQFGTR